MKDRQLLFVVRQQVFDMTDLLSRRGEPLGMLRDRRGLGEEQASSEQGGAVADPEASTGPEGEPQGLQLTAGGEPEGCQERYGQPLKNDGAAVGRRSYGRIAGGEGRTIFR